MHANLQPIEPGEAQQWYLEDRADGLSENTLKAHGYRTKHFVRWCGIEGIDNMNVLTGRHFARYKAWRQEDGDLNNVSLHTQLSTLRVFVKFCERINAVTPGLHEYVQPPEMAPREDVSTTKIHPDRVRTILEYLRKYEYATREHVTLELLWHCGFRTGDLIALDVEDFHPENHYVEVNHRPDTGTPLKNGDEGERWVKLRAGVVELLDDYLSINRLETVDEFGRNPLITTEYGRMARQTVRRSIYSLSRPCVLDGECPHDREIENCQAAQDRSYGSKCPSSVSPHPIRKAAISYFLSQEDIYYDDVSERCDVSQDVLKQHYDQRRKEESMLARGEKFTFEDKMTEKDR